MSTAPVFLSQRRQTDTMTQLKTPPRLSVGDDDKCDNAVADLGGVRPHPPWLGVLRKKFRVY